MYQLSTMKSLYFVMFFAMLSYVSATHHLKTIKKEHHFAPHHETLVKEVVLVHKPIPPVFPKHHSPVFHKHLPPPPPPLLPIFPPKPIHKHHQKVYKEVPITIVKPVPVPVPVPVKVPAVKHHVPVVLPLIPKPLPHLGKDLHKIKVHEHINERYIY